MKRSLTEKEEQAVCRIVEEANRHDRTCYTAPLDADAYCLSCHGGEPVAFLAVYGMGDTRGGRRVEEILLFTAPEFRNRGRARRLWNRYLSAPETRQLSVRFSAYACPAAEQFLLHEKAEHDHDEVLMARQLDGKMPPEAEPEETEFRMQNAFSECSVKTYGTVGYIYGVRTDASHLREGSAGGLMQDAFAELWRRGASRAVLEVSSSNLPAWNLYRKLGFEVEERLQIWYIDIL